jgi:branched-chain amino acid transport system ATP-binding protein
MLRVANINTFYSKLQALWDITFHVDGKEIVALIGANGAGKTTILNTISHFVIPSSGRIDFLGKRIDLLPPHRVVELGIAHVPEGRRLFPEMTVHENLELGAYTSVAWPKRDETLEQIYRLFPILEARGRKLARTLSGGEQQMLAIARGLLSRPKLCMFDEPSSGLAPIIVGEVFRVIRTLREQGTTVLLVEQNIQRTLDISDRVYVLENGRIVLDGRSKEVLQDEHVKKAYMGL